MSKHTPTSRRLVRDLMQVGVPSCDPSTGIADLAQALLEKEQEGFVVLDSGGHAIGTVSREELARAYATGETAGLVAADIMREEVPQVPPDIPLTAAAQIMHDLGTRILFIMHHAGGIEYPAAMLSYRHLLRHVAAGEEGHLADLGIEAEREPPLETFFRRRAEARRRATQE